MPALPIHPEGYPGHPESGNEAHALSIGRSWRVDETYVRIRGEWCYLYRAVDRAGRTIDFRLSTRRDVAAAKAFFRKAMKSQQCAPQTITLDGYATSHRAVSRARHLPGAAMPVNISARLPNEPGMADDADTERVTFTIANLRSINSKRLYALVDVEIRVAGLSFRIIGVQIQRGSGGLSVHLPTHRDVNGAWKPVVEMPEELREPMSDAVMGFLVDEGMAKRK